MKITKSQLKNLIKEEIQNLFKSSFIDSRGNVWEYKFINKSQSEAKFIKNKIKTSYYANYNESNINWMIYDASRENIVGYADDLQEAMEIISEYDYEMNSF